MTSDQAWKIILDSRAEIAFISHQIIALRQRQHDAAQRLDAAYEQLNGALHTELQQLASPAPEA